MHAPDETELDQQQSKTEKVIAIENNENINNNNNENGDDTVSISSSINSNTTFGCTTRHSLRTMLFFCCSALVLAIHSVLVSKDGGRIAFWKFSFDSSSSTITTSNVEEGMKNISSVDIYFSDTRRTSSNFENSNNNDDENAVACVFHFNTTQTKKTIVDLEGDDEEQLLLTRQNLGIATISVAIGFVLPCLCGTYIFSDAFSSSDLKKIFCLTVVTVLSLLTWLALLISLLVEIGKQNKTSIVIGNSNSNNNDDLKQGFLFPWAIIIVISFFVILLVIWKINKLRMISTLLSQVVDENENNNTNSNDNEPNTEMKEEEEVTTENNNNNNNSSSNRNETIHDEEKEEEKEEISFYQTRNGMARAMLLFVILFSLNCSAMCSFFWSSSSSSSSSSSPFHRSILFGPTTSRCETTQNDFYSNSVNFSQLQSNLTAIRSQCFSTTKIGNGETDSIFLGLNGTNLFLGILVALGASLGWSWCLVPITFIGCIFSVVVVAIQASMFNELKDCSSSSSSPTITNKIELGWSFYLEIVVSIIWFLASLLGCILQVAVPDVVLKD